MKIIQLTQGKSALVDDADYAELSQFKWHAHQNRKGKWYAQRKMGHRHVRIHEFLTGVMCDHKDLDGLNNQRSNLRPCTHSQNMANQGVRATNKSGYKGVFWNPQRGRWRANFRGGYLGSFLSSKDAAAAYDEAAVRHFGEFALTNKKMGLL